MANLILNVVTSVSTESNASISPEITLLTPRCYTLNIDDVQTSFKLVWSFIHKELLHDNLIKQAMLETCITKILSKICIMNFS